MLVADPVLQDYYANQDPVIRDKVNQMVARLRQFCPSCDEAFWTRVRKERISDPNYSLTMSSRYCGDILCI